MTAEPNFLSLVFRPRVASVYFAFVLLAACNTDCCFVGFIGKHDCGPIGGGGECGLLPCVSIGIDQTSLACFPRGSGPYFITSQLHTKKVTATYQATLAIDGVPQKNPPPSHITLSPDAKIFLGCSHDSGDVTLPTTDSTFTLLNYSTASLAAADAKPVAGAAAAVALLDTAVPVRELKPALGATERLDIASCRKLCDSLNGKCRFLPADSLIETQEQLGLAKLFALLTKGHANSIPQAQLLQLFSMKSDPCSRGTTDFTGQQSGRFSNKGGGCTLSLSKSAVLGGTATRWVGIPLELSGTFSRDDTSITLLFSNPDNMASYNAMTSNPEVLTRLNLDQINAQADRIIASAGDQCVDFRYSNSPAAK